MLGSLTVNIIDVYRYKEHDWYLVDGVYKKCFKLVKGPEKCIIRMAESGELLEVRGNELLHYGSLLQALKPTQSIIVPPIQ